MVVVWADYAAGDGTGSGGGNAAAGDPTIAITIGFVGGTDPTKGFNDALPSIFDLSFELTLINEGTTQVEVIPVDPATGKATKQVSPGNYSMEVNAKVNEWDYAEGIVPAFSVASSETKDVAITMQRIPNAIALTIPKVTGTLVIPPVFFGLPTTPTFPINIYNFSSGSVTVTGTVPSPLTVSGSSSFAIPISQDSFQSLALEINGTPIWPNADYNSGLLDIIESGTTICSITIQSSVYSFTRSYLASAIASYPSGSVISLPAATITFDGSPISIDKDITLVAAGASGTTLQRDPSYTDAFFNITGSGSLTLQGSASSPLTLDGNRTASATGDSLVIVNGGMLSINSDVALTENFNSGGNGGAVRINSGTFYMGGGTISSCEADNGGGVYIAGGTFNMNDGVLGNNIASDNGDAVYVSGTFNYTNPPASINFTVTGGGGIVYDAGGTIIVNGVPTPGGW